MLTRMDCIFLTFWIMPWILRAGWNEAASKCLLCLIDLFLAAMLTRMDCIFFTFWIMPWILCKWNWSARKCALWIDWVASYCDADLDGSKFFFCLESFGEYYGNGMEQPVSIQFDLLSRFLMRCWRGWIVFSLLFESCGEYCGNGMEQAVRIWFAWLTCFLLQCWRGWIVFSFWIMP